MENDHDEGMEMDNPSEDDLGRKRKISAVTAEESEKQDELSIYNQNNNSKSEKSRQVIAISN